MPAKKPMAEWKHGTHGTYVNGCRCVLCRAAKAAYSRQLYHANLARARAACRAKYHRRMGARSVGDMDAALIKRDRDYREAVATATGEVAALVAEQVRDDVMWIKPDLRNARPFDESRWGGYGEYDPTTALEDD